MFYLWAGLGFAGLTLLYIKVILPRRRFPSRFRSITEKRMQFFLYLHGKWNREILLPFREIRLGMDPSSDFSFATLVDLQAESIADLPSQILLSPTDEYIRVTSDRPLLIQGVERSSGWLRVNGILRSGPVKIVFKGPLEVKERVRVKPSFSALANYYGPGVASGFLALLCIAVGLYTLNSHRTGNKTPFAPIQLPAPQFPLPPASSQPSAPAIIASIESFPTTSEPRPSSAGVALTGPSIPPSSGGSASLTGSIPSASAQLHSRKGEPWEEPLPDFPDSLPIVAPGGKIPQVPIKVLFVHAHPDDESIEFGTLMALCKKQGIPTATVLFTDGEGGIFSKEYSGPRTSLREIRIREAAWALHTLGSALYIRLGLSNLPYNGVRDEQKATEVIQRWSSSKPTDRMVEILLTLKPDIVISPEEPSRIRKHFEHEAVALVVKNAIDRVRRMGHSYPRGYLQSLDPRSPLDLKGSVSFARNPVVELQRKALSYHRTQADAFYFGVQRTEKYPAEVYRVKFWSLEEDPLLFFMERAPKQAP